MLRYVLNKVIDLQVFAKMVCDQRLHVRQQYRRQPKGPCLRLRKHGHQGVNFINNLQVAFKRADPESAKKTDNLIEFFLMCHCCLPWLWSFLVSLCHHLWLFQWCIWRLLVLTIVVMWIVEVVRCPIVSIACSGRDFLAKLSKLLSFSKPGKWRDLLQYWSDLGVKGTVVNRTRHFY